MSMFTEILNPFIKTRNQVKNKHGEWIDQVETKTQEEVKLITGLRETVDQGYKEVYKTVAEKTIIDSFLISATKFVYPILWINDITSTDIGSNMFHSVGRELRYYPSMQRINESGNDYFSVINEYESSDEKYYTVELKKPIIIPKGSTIAFSQAEGEGEVTYKLVLREFWEVEK